MITVKELRIGNIIEYKSKLISINGIPGEQGVFYSANDLYDYGERMAYLKDCSPIPLSEEILLKCGFSRFFEFSNADANYRISTMQRYLTIGLLHGRYIANIYHQVEIKYLHQLQNLYFALTGQELNTSGL